MIERARPGLSGRRTMIAPRGDAIRAMKSGTSSSSTTGPLPRSTTRSTRDGIESAARNAQTAPIEWPTTVARSSSEPVEEAAHDPRHGGAVAAGRVSRPAELSPCPGRSTSRHRWPASSRTSAAQAGPVTSVPGKKMIGLPEPSSTTRRRVPGSGMSTKCSIGTQPVVVPQGLLCLAVAVGGDRGSGRRCRFECHDVDPRGGRNAPTVPARRAEQEVRTTNFHSWEPVGQSGHDRLVRLLLVHEGRRVPRRPLEHGHRPRPAAPRDAWASTRSPSDCRGSADLCSPPGSASSRLLGLIERDRSVTKGVARLPADPRRSRAAARCCTACGCGRSGSCRRTRRWSSAIRTSCPRGSSSADRSATACPTARSCST